MRRILWLVALAGCTPSGFNGWVVVDHPEPTDPESVLFTLHADGRVTSDGRELTRADIIARVPRGEAELNRTPVLFEVEPTAGFHVVRDALAILVGKPACVNFAFRVAAGTVTLPMPADRGLGLNYYEGRSEMKRVDGGKRLELLVSPAKDGALYVTAVNFTIPSSEPAIYFPPAGEKATDHPPLKEPAWTGEHPPCGVWSKNTLVGFLARKDVAALSPYVQLKVMTREPASDVIRCLSTLRSIDGLPVVPEIPTAR